MQNQENLQEDVVELGHNPQLWSSRPVLGTLLDQNYLGRVIIEVWENEQTRLVTSEQSLLDVAQMALEMNRYSSKQPKNISFNPATGENGDSLFAGQVIIELWTNQVNVGSTGSATQVDYLLSQAKKTLKSNIQ